MSPEGGGGGEPPLYRNVTTNDRVGTRAKCHTFESLSPHMREQFLTREKGLNKEMDVEPSTSHPKASRGWEPGKCIPQSKNLPRYIIRSMRVGEHTQFMREHALIGKFLGLWPSERDLYTMDQILVEP
jgi:hypothetical protein